MSSTHFKPLFETRSEPFKQPLTRLSNIFKDSFTLPTLLLLGALVQTTISLILPTRYSLIPLVLLLLHTVTTTIIEIYSPSAWSNGGLGTGVVTKKVSAQIPNPTYNSSSPESSSSLYPSTPAATGIVCLHLGIRFNHPLGVLSPLASRFNEVNSACNARVMAHLNSSSNEDFGCLGMTSWAGTESSSKNTVMTVYYFRDIEGLNKFAHDKVHRTAWDFYNNEFCKKMGYSHIGVFHETFYAPREMWETIYMNIQPTLLGRAFAGVDGKGGKDKKEWVSTLVDGGHKSLRSQWGRMGRTVKAAESEEGDDMYA